MADRISIADLAGVVYSSGKVFNGLSTGRLDTENFLRSGSLDGISSRADLALLEDLRDAAQYVIDSPGPVDAGWVRRLNATMIRSGALHPGRLRTQDQGIGVSTRHGRHTPPALTEAGLQEVVDAALGAGDVREVAIELFVGLAAAQPFEDGNKRTAVFAANGLLIGAGAGVLLTIPVDESAAFNDELARAYIYGDRDGVEAMLHEALR